MFAFKFDRLFENVFQTKKEPFVLILSINVFQFSFKQKYEESILNIASRQANFTLTQVFINERESELFLNQPL